MAAADSLSAAPSPDQRGGGRRWALIVLISCLSLAGIAGFGALGLWQIQRLHWKLALIERVDARVHAAPVAAPSPDQWPGITAEGDEYRHIALTGHFLNAEEVQIYTPSDEGPAYWVLTPFARDDGTVVMVNRGQVPEALKDPATRTPPEGRQTVTGLLRISEAKGWLFSRANDPAAGQWYRRDIASITAAKGLTNAAPYFVDQDLRDPQAWPRGGQTVISFRNSHLSYALTWFALVALCLVAWGLFLRHEWHRQPQDQT
jgi:surfeit locus 1 family protein